MAQDAGWPPPAAKNPAFTVVAVLTLALGLGRMRDLQRGERVAAPAARRRQRSRSTRAARTAVCRQTTLSNATYPDFLDYRAGNTVMSGLAAIVPTAFHVSARGETERLQGELVSGDYFSVLGVTAARGRLIALEDERDAGADPVAVISFRLWQRLFGGDAGAIGSTVKIDGHDLVVIGVASEPFTGVKIGTPRDVWVPLTTLRRTDPKIAARFDQRRAS